MHRSIQAVALLGFVATSGCSYDAGESPVAVEHTSAALSNPTENCSQEQADQIGAALSQAYNYSLLVMNDLGEVRNGGDTTLFDYWFGDHPDYVQDTVAKTYKQIVDIFDTATFVCGCTNPPPLTFGQTLQGGANPDRRIELCDDYFSGDFEEVGIGALFHEASHIANTGHYLVASCGPDGDHYAWPETIHLAAEGQAGWASANAESYRLYALRWAPGRRSTFPDACP